MYEIIQVIAALARLLQFAIIGRVLMSWVDPNPYPTNGFKRGLWAVTDPILEPMRRVIPPLGMFDITPIAAIFLLDFISNALRSAFPF